MPNLMGVKFTDEHIMDFVLCAQLAGGKYNMLFGRDVVTLCNLVGQNILLNLNNYRDEILLSALATGACEGDVGSTLNYMSFNLDVRQAERHCSQKPYLISINLAKTYGTTTQVA